VKQIKQVIAVLLFSVIFSSAWANLPNDITNIIYFGDSLTDVGNRVGSNMDLCTTPTAPVTNKTGGALPGELWSKQLDVLFGKNDTAASKNDGNVWAVSGDETIDVLDQVSAYLASVGGTVPNQKDLFVVWAGSNDVIDRIFLSQPPVSPTKVIIQGTTNILTAMERLFHAGAQRFLIMNVPDISLTPVASNPSEPLFPFQSEAKLASFSWDAVLFDPDPKTGPVAYFHRLHPEAEIYTLDTFALLNNLVADPVAEGFPDEIDGKPNNQQQACKFAPADSDDFIFYNLIHPTTATHTIIAADAMAAERWM